MQCTVQDGIGRAPRRCCQFRQAAVRAAELYRPAGTERLPRAPQALGSQAPFRSLTSDSHRLRGSIVVPMIRIVSIGTLERRPDLDIGTVRRSATGVTRAMRA